MCLVEIAATKDCVLVFCIKCLQCAQISPKLSQRHRERKKREVGEEANKQRDRQTENECRTLHEKVPIHKTSHSLWHTFTTIIYKQQKNHSHNGTGTIGMRRNICLLSSAYCTFSHSDSASDFFCTQLIPKLHLTLNGVNQLERVHFRQFEPQSCQQLLVCCFLNNV